MENRVFYLKFLEYDAVPVETHVTADMKKREFPLTTVAHLIRAFQILPHSPLASIFSGRIKLYSVDNSNAATDALRPGTLLASLAESTGQTDETPLILESIQQPVAQRSVDPSLVMDLDVPPAFNPTSHSLRDMLEFPFFDINVEAYLKTVGPTALLARDDCIKKVNECVSDRLIFDKYHPIICSTSRGMGKTAFMEAIGMRIVKPELRNGFIQEAHAYGRVVSFDFASDAAAKAYPTESDIETFFTRLMIYFLCRMFGGTQVEGIHFEVCEFGNVELFAGRQPKFNTWKQHCMQKHADRMMDEYIRLTNAAFGVNCDTPPVFLLDEIQGLCKPTSVQSKLEEDGNIVYHSYLTLLLTQLAGKHKPLCICAGTNSGKIISITERSRIIPHFITLSTPTTQKITACFGVK